MWELTKWYFKAVWENYPLDDNIISIWFGRLWGTLMSPFILFLGFLVWAVVKIADSIGDRHGK